MGVVKWNFLVFLLLIVRRCFMLGGRSIPEKFDVVWYNESYYDKPSIILFDHDAANDVKALNVTMTLKQDLPDVVMIHVQVYKKSGNEYLVFPLNVTTDICPLLARESPDTKKLKEHSNMSGCPMKKGTYRITNMIMEKRKTPAYIPVGNYMAESTTSIENDVKLLTTRSYAKVVA